MVSQIIVVNETSDLYLVIRKDFTPQCDEDEEGASSTVWKFESPNLLVSMFNKIIYTRIRCEYIDEIGALKFEEQNLMDNLN